MKFIVSSSALLKHLQAISGVLNSSNTLPILDNFLFETKEDQLIIAASDLETTMTTTLEPEKIEENGAVAIPAKLLLDTLKTFPDQPLSFLVNTETFAIDISSDNGQYSLAGANGDEFPKIPEVESPSKLSLDSGALFNAINKSLFATGNDELRPVMSGVYFELGTDSCTFVATDAHKLVRYRRKDAKSERSSSFIMPKKPLNLLKNITSGLNTTVEIEYNEVNAYFKADNIELVCRLIDGKYPNYEAVIPKENPNKLTIGRTSLLSSIRRISIFSNKTTHQVRLKMAGSELTISAEDVDFNNAANEKLTASYAGEDMEIGFNSRFLIEMLSNLDSDNIILEMSAPNRAGIITPETSDEDEDILMLVMPVMLNR